MLTHDEVWAALDALAARNRLTASGLARLSGLDPTSFNKSKRATNSGRLRWPSTKSIAKALKATKTNLDDFLTLIPGRGQTTRKRDRSGGASSTAGYRVPESRHVPLIGFAQAGVGGFFDDGGFPAGQGWDEVRFPAPEHDAVYALEVSGDSMQPLYRDGDIIIVQPGAPVRKGDRVVVKIRSGEVMVKVLARQTARGAQLMSLNPAHPELTYQANEIEWIARIVWASQ